MSWDFTVVVSTAASGLMIVVDSSLALFSGQILTYDAVAARSYANMREKRRDQGLALSVEDGMIAAICESRGAALATRNITDFVGLGIELINPWNAAA